MRLSDVLSRSPKSEFIQVEAFLVGKKGIVGQQIQLAVGEVMLNYYCLSCGDVRTFRSKGKLFCVFVNKKIISIDCVMTCGCGANVQVWFLVECEKDICALSPKIRILKRSEKLSEDVRHQSERYGEFSPLLNDAEHAFREGLGAGAIVYLRKAFERITVQTANAIGLDYDKYEGGNPKNFRKLLEKVDEQSSIIPKEFSRNSYQLFRELSGVVHGEYNEDKGLEKFEALHRLVVGILENVLNSIELKSAIKSLGWKDETGVDIHE